ncbi:MAG: hypothetical protein D9V47_13975 [Clostridia bacterium]|nr:MAG: hypothetical protein D9V47_13975 [Clostridia bacterium]
MKLVVDPGHGGRDPGAVGPDLGLAEKTTVLDVGLALRDFLAAYKFEVVMTRTDDTFVSLRRRVETANSARPELVLSLHVNSSENRDARYFSAHVFSRQGPAAHVAEAILPPLAEVSGWPNGGIRVNNFYVLRETVSPAVLLELGFISNREQEMALSRPDWHRQLARAIATGLAGYYQVEPAAPFPDIGGHWAGEAIAAVAKNGFMQGYPDGYFWPDKEATRAEVAVAIYRLWQKVADTEAGKGRAGEES